MAELNVNPADLLRVADAYSDLATRAAHIAPQAATEVQRIAETHGPMGYPTMVGIAAALAKSEGALAAKVADFTSHSQRFTEHAATYQNVDGEGTQRLNRISSDLHNSDDKRAKHSSGDASALSWKPSDPRRKPFIAGPSGMGPPQIPDDPWIRVGPRSSGIWVPENELPGVIVSGPGGLGPPPTPDSPYIELIPGSGVWAPKSDFPHAILQAPGSLGPPGPYREWLPGSGIWMPSDQLR